MMRSITTLRIMELNNTLSIKKLSLLTFDQITISIKNKPLSINEA